MGNSSSSRKRITNENDTMGEARPYGGTAAAAVGAGAKRDTSRPVDVTSETSQHEMIHTCSSVYDDTEVPPSFIPISAFIIEAYKLVCARLPFVSNAPHAYAMLKMDVPAICVFKNQEVIPPNTRFTDIGRLFVTASEIRFVSCARTRVFEKSTRRTRFVTQAWPEVPYTVSLCQGRRVPWKHRDCRTFFCRQLARR